MENKFGFTLAEVLITLGIIGIVAAITMPTLIQNHQKRSLEAATKKFYSMMSQAVKQYMADEGVDDLRNTPLSSENYEDDMNSPEAIASIKNFVTKYLKVVKECDKNKNDCFAPKYKAWNGGETVLDFTSTIDYGSMDAQDYVLANGTIIRIRYHSFDGPISIYADVNGKKGPNRVGYDLWGMSIFYDGIIDESGVTPETRRGEPSYLTPEKVRDMGYDSNCQNGQYGGCFGHFLENNFKFDY